MSMHDTFEVDGLTPKELLSLTDQVYNKTSAFLDKPQRSGHLEEIIKTARRYGADRIELLGAGAEAVAYEISGRGFEAVIRVEADGKPIKAIAGILPMYEDKKVEGLRISVMPKYQLVDELHMDFRKKNDILIQLSRLLASKGYATPEVMNERNVGIYTMRDGTRVAGVFDPGSQGSMLLSRDSSDARTRKTIDVLGEIKVDNPLVAVWNEQERDIRRDVAQRGGDLRKSARNKSYPESDRAEKTGYQPTETGGSSRQERERRGRGNGSRPSSSPSGSRPPRVSIDYADISETLSAWGVIAEDMSDIAAVGGVLPLMLAASVSPWIIAKREAMR